MLGLWSEGRKLTGNHKLTQAALFKTPGNRTETNFSPAICHLPAFPETAGLGWAKEWLCSPYQTWMFACTRTVTSAVVNSLMYFGKPFHFLSFISHILSFPQVFWYPKDRGLSLFGMWSMSSAFSFKPCTLAAEVEDVEEISALAS